MDPSPHRPDEVRSLTDAIFDGDYGPTELERLEHLITSDLRCLQTYVEQINFHGVVSQMARQQAPEQAVLAVMDQFAKAIRLRDKREKRFIWWTTTALVLTALTIVGAIFIPSSIPGEPVGKISHLTANLTTSKGTALPGRILRNGDAIKINDGILSIRLNHAVVDVLGPAEFCLSGPNEIELISGKIITKISDGFSGFRVKTPAIEVVDFGTEFLVSHDDEFGTSVSVREGRVQMNLKGRRGDIIQTMDLTDHRAARFTGHEQSIREIPYEPEVYAPVDTVRAGIVNIDGMLRTTQVVPRSFLAGDLPTRNHILIVPELQRVELQNELKVMSSEGPLTIAAGTVVSSYLVHYDPPGDLSLAPRGAVEFSDKILGVLASSPSLNSTDQLFGAPNRTFDHRPFRGLELGPDSDSIQISQDRKTISFHLDMDPPENLDEARILIIHQP